MAGELVLLTSPGCHMCAHARLTLGELGVAWREVAEDSPEGATLTATAPPLRPVLFDASGAVVAYGRLSARRLRRDIARGRVHANGVERSHDLHRASRDSVMQGQTTWHRSAQTSPKP